MLRAYFRYDRRLLGELCRVAAGVIAESFRGLLGQPAAEPGLVICVHTFGNLLNFHPHLHVMATDGGFTPDGRFHPLPAMSPTPIEERRVVRAILGHLSLWDGARPPPAAPGVVPHEPAELEYLPCVE